MGVRKGAANTQPPFVAKSAGEAGGQKRGPFLSLLLEKIFHLSPPEVRSAEDVLTVQDLQVLVGDVVIADEAEAVSPYGHRCVQSHTPPGVQGGYGGRGACSIGAVGYLQVKVGDVAVADEAKAICSYRHRCGPSHTPPPVSREVMVLAVGMARLTAAPKSPVSPF